MAMALAEVDHDQAARMHKAAEAEARIMLGYLAEVRFDNRWDRQDVEHFRKAAALEPAQIDRVKDMTWKYRRQLPKHLAPKLPPHDPIVKEMEAARG
jgi:hypothetical protein